MTMMARKVRLLELKPNPFKKYIREGQLYQDRIEKLKESINRFGNENGGFWKGLRGREIEDGSIELCFGHHRIAAAIEVFGSSVVMLMPVFAVGECSDDDMFDYLFAENSYRSLSAEERTDSVKLAVAKTRHDLNRVPNLGTLLNPEVNPEDFDPEWTSPRRLERVMGLGNWPNQRISEILGQLREKLAAQVQQSQIESHTVSDVKKPTEEKTTDNVETQVTTAEMLTELDRMAENAMTFPESWSKPILPEKKAKTQIVQSFPETSAPAVDQIKFCESMVLSLGSTERTWVEKVAKADVRDISPELKSKLRIALTKTMKPLRELEEELR